MSYCQCYSALSPTLCLPLFLWKRSEDAVTRAIRDFVFFLTVKRRIHTHTHTYTSVHTHHPSPAAPCADRNWAKVHSATVLTIYFSTSLRLRITPCRSYKKDTQQSLTSSLSVSARLSLSLSGLSPLSFVSIFSLLLLALFHSEVTRFLCFPFVSFHQSLSICAIITPSHPLASSFSHYSQ